MAFAVSDFFGSATPDLKDKLSVLGDKYLCNSSSCLLLGPAQRFCLFVFFGSFLFSFFLSFLPVS